MPTPGFDDFCEAVAEHDRISLLWRMSGRPVGERDRIAVSLAALESAGQRLHAAWGHRWTELADETDAAVRLAGYIEIGTEMRRATALLAEADRGQPAMN